MERILVGLFGVALGIVIIVGRRQLAQAVVDYQNKYKYFMFTYGSKELDRFTTGNVIVGTWAIALGLYNLLHGLNWI